MKQWEINFDGWYPYCPVCKQETLFRTPICLVCGADLEPDEKDMEKMQKVYPELYSEVMHRLRHKDKYYKEQLLTK